MNKQFFYSVLFLLCSITTGAQELKVKSFGVAQGDLSANVNPRSDRNGVACGLVKVQLAVEGAKFNGSVVGDVTYSLSEYWVYMNDGAYLLEVHCPGFLPLSINLHDHGLKDGVQPKTTYRLVLAKPAGQDEGMNYLTLMVKPANSKVTVNGQIREVDSDGSVSLYVPAGTYSYQVEAPGYATQTGQITVSGEAVTKQITLTSSMASLRVSCATPGAQIYINNQLKGTAPWSGTLAAGSYLIEARKEGLRSQKRSEVIAERDDRKIELPALEAPSGSLNVNYKPVQSEVWLDGKRLGTSPSVFRNINPGRHEVEIRKSGYQTKKETVTVADGQTTNLTGTLSATQVNRSNTIVKETNKTVSSPESVETFTVGGVSFNMVRVEGGTFMMGSEDSDAYDAEKPVHQVTLSSYAIGETEVTQELWQTVMGSNPSHFKGTNLPVEKVSWADCQKFIRKLNAMTGRTFRLPTEAEWEFAARGGNKSRGYKYSGSNIYYNSFNTHSVKKRKANELGLYNMTGNVLEWCQDWYGSYDSNAQTDPTGPESGSFRVIRGGSWIHNVRFCPSSFRNFNSPWFCIDFLGLRLAL